MKKNEGFPGQISYVIPDRIQNIIQENPLISDLYLTDIGYYPNAKHHFRERTKGINQCIIIYCTSGKGIVIIENQNYELNADHFIFIPSNIVHSYYSDIKDPWSIYWIHFSGKKATLFNRFGTNPIYIERSDVSRIRTRLDLFEEIFSNLERGLSVETLEYVNLNLHYLLSTFSHIQQFRMINESGDKDPVSLSINFMLENLTKQLKLESFAKVAKLSVSHYSRLFVEKTSHSPIDYFNQLKIQQSCRWLDISDLSVADISREMGFEDPFYFSRLFKKIMGMSPQKYKQKH